MADAHFGKAAVFRTRGLLLVLPAFGAFTGGQARPPTPDARRDAVGAGRVWALP